MIRGKRLAALLYVLLPALVVHACAGLPLPLIGAEARLARGTTIVRDEFGVPTVYGPTDAAVVYGLAYAQAEDEFRHIEEVYIHALGRAAHWYGDRYLAADLVKAAFEVERLAREEYDREPAERRALWDAWAAGMNAYMSASGVRPRLIGRYEPWMPFALVRAVEAGMLLDGVRLGDAGNAGQHATSQAGSPARAGVRLHPRGPAVTLAGSWEGESRTESRVVDGSIAWAVSGGRSGAGGALLLQSVHAAFEGGGARYEAHVHSAAGWHVRGVSHIGGPIPVAGHNEHYGWAHTATGADHADVYEVAFDHSTDPLLYRRDDEWLRAETWTDTLLVNTVAGVEAREFTFVRTHHGPVIAQRGDRALAVRIARMEEGGALQQWYAMGRASDLDGFRRALAETALPGVNTLYADREGSIYSLYGNAVPVRDTTVDWSRPVDGTTSRTEWRGLHPISELPELYNPRSGWIRSSGLAALPGTAAGHDVDPARYPRYMLGGQANASVPAELRILEADGPLSFEVLGAAAFDPYVAGAEDAFGRLVRDWEEVGGTAPDRAMRADGALDALRAWDRRATAESPEATLYVLWQERLRSGEYGGAHASFRALEDVIEQLARDHGSTLVPWGEVNRLWRAPAGSTAPADDARAETAVPGDARDEIARAPDAHTDAAAGLPASGAPAWAGGIFAFESRRVPGTAARRGVAGSAWISVVEFGPSIRSASIVPYGQSADPTSPHGFDQARLYGRGELKAARFERDEVMAASGRAYRPGSR